MFLILRCDAKNKKEVWGRVSFDFLEGHFKNSPRFDSELIHYLERYDHSHRGSPHSSDDCAC